MDEDLKHAARQRREMTLKAMREGHDYTTRKVPPAHLYKRKPKYRPVDFDSWEEAFR